MKIIKDFITPGRRNRPMTNPASSLYKKTMQAKYITVHEAWSNANAKTLHDHVKSTGAANRPASWHFSVDEKEVYQALPLNESGWHAGDNLGPGNTTTIGIEICDYGMRRDNNWHLFWQAVDHCAKLCAYLINTVDSLEPYPKCLKQHYDWSGKNCPALIRNGKHWQTFVSMVGEYLEAAEETKPKKDGYAYRVITGSYEILENAQENAKMIRQLGPSILGLIVYNETGSRYLYRVIAAEHNNERDAETVRQWLQSKGVNSFILAGQFKDLTFPKQEPEQEPEPEPEPEGPGSDNNSGIVEFLKKLIKLITEFLANIN